MRTNSLIYRLEEWGRDRYYGLRTRGFIDEHRLGLPKGSFAYAPTPYVLLDAMLAEVADLRAGTLIDFGSGLGRVCAVSARKFRRVIGVEYSADLADSAREQIAARNVTIVTGDASTFEIPDDATVFFFASPFGTEIMRSVFGNIERSLRRAPRKAVLLCYNRKHFAEAAESFPWIVQRKWIQVPKLHASWTVCDVRFAQHKAVAAIAQ